MQVLPCNACFLLYAFTCADILLEKGEIKAEEIWDIYKRAPRIPQVALEINGFSPPVRGIHLS